MKKFIVLFAVVLLLVGFVNYENVLADKVTIRYAAVVNEAVGYDEVLKSAVKNFNSEHPDIEVVLDPIPPSNYQDKINLELATGKGPDLFDAEIGWTLDYVNRGVIASAPQDYAEKLREIAFAGPLETLEFKGKIWGGPPFTDCLALFYNKDMFKENGIEVPETWNELKEVAVKLTKRDDNGDLVQSGFTHWAAYEHVFWSFFYQNGGSFVDNDPIKMITSKEAIEAADFAFHQSYREWNVASTSFYKGWEGFGAGKVAMSIHGNWYLKYLDTATDINYDVAPLPGHKEKASTQGGWNVLVNKNAPEEAWEFVDYLTTDVGVNLDKMKTCNYLPAVKTVYKEVNWGNVHPELKTFYKQLPYARSMPFFEGFQEFKNGFTSALETLTTSDKNTSKVINNFANQLKRTLQ